MSHFVFMFIEKPQFLIDPIECLHYDQIISRMQNTALHQNQSIDL